MASGDLVELGPVKEWLQIEPTSTDADSLLERIITATSGFVASTLNNPVVAVDLTETYDSYGRDFLLLRHYPVLSVAGVYCGGSEMLRATGDGMTSRWNNGWVLAPFEGANQRLTAHGRVFPNGRSSVVVKYRAGYETVPADVQQAVWELVGARYRYLDRIGYTSKSLGGQETVSFAPNRMDDYTKALLQPYMRVTPS